MERAILINGLVRKPEQFETSLAAIESAQGHKQAALIFSTWVNELKNYPKIRSQLSRMDAIVIEQRQPNLILNGHMLHQAVSLDAGLSFLGDDVFVLKARPDFCIDWWIPAFLQHSPEQLRARSNERFSFSHRILVTGAQIANPFYIDDMTFAGVARDLRQLVRIPFVFGIRYSRLAPEQWLWATPFLASYAALDAFFRVNVGLIFGDPDRSAALHRVLIESSLYAHAVALGIAIFRENFGFFGDAGHEIVRERARSFALEALLWDDVQLPNMFHHPNAHTNMHRSRGAMEAIAQGECRQSEFGERVKEIMAQIANDRSSPASSMERTRLYEDAAELGEKIEKIVEIPGMKHFRDFSKNRSIAGADPQWTFGQLGTDITARLESENNNLRRTVDQLNSRLSELGREKGKA